MNTKTMKTLDDTLIVLALGILLCGCRMTDSAARSDFRNSLGRFNVRAFGARGDGQTDDTKAFQSALDAAAKVSGTVFVPAATYRVGKLVWHDFTITGNLFLRSGAVLERERELAAHERCAVWLVGVDGLTFTGNSTTVGGNDASMQRAVPSPEYGLAIQKLDHAVITGNRLVGTGQALLDLGEHGDQVIIRDNVTEVKPPATRTNN
jgi:polygalacturonase